MSDRVLFTDRREELLEEGYDTSDQSDRNAMSRFRKSNRTALNELIEVAESPYIDNKEIFAPDDVFRLLRALLTPKQRDIEGDEYTFHITEDNYTNEFQGFSDRLEKQMSKLILDDPVKWIEDDQSGD